MIILLCNHDNTKELTSLIIMNICPIITIDLFRQRRRFLCHQQLNCSTVSSGIQKGHGAIMGVGGGGVVEVVDLIKSYKFNSFPLVRTYHVYYQIMTYHAYDVTEIVLK